MSRSLFTTTALATVGAVAAMSAALPGSAAVAAAAQSAVAAAAAPASSGLLPSVAEQSASTRLADRRSIVIGDRFYEVGAEDGSYPAAGFHTRGEMGGFWTPPIKLLDGLWFNVDGRWLSTKRYTTGWGYTRMDMGSQGGVTISRTDFAPDGLRAGLVGITLKASRPTTVSLRVDAHSELMKSYPWGETTPSQLVYNLPDTAAYSARSLQFREVGTPPVPHPDRHDYAAVVGSRLRPVAHTLGRGFRGPQTPAVICPPSGPTAPPQTVNCDDTAYGNGVGGQLRYAVMVPTRGTTVWFAVAGSDHGLADARRAQAAALANPDALLAAKVAHRQALAARTDVRLPGDPLLQSSVAWSKQNLADSVQEARDLHIRITHAGTTYPAPVGTVAKVRWIGAGWPDYPWIFGTDGEYTALSAVAAGQFDAIKNHLRTLRAVSLVANGDTGKVVHEVTPDGQVYFGANGDPGNTDETAKFPSAVALVWRWTGDAAFRDQMYAFTVKNMRYIYRTLDADNDGWPEGLGNVERSGMGVEKLDNAVYTVRGLRDLADMAASKHDSTTQRWATDRAASLERRFEAAWWYGANGATQYADSLADPGNVKVFQRHWIGLTPIEAELVRPGKPAGPLASTAHAREALAQREGPCYTSEFGLFHTGTGPTSDPAGNPGASCDTAVSTVPSERTVFTLNTSIIAVAEAAEGRMGRSQLQRYTTANARVQLDPSVVETPGLMPEISPSPDFGANIDRLYTQRSMALQAWGTYGILWPVVHFELGVAPDLGRGAVQVVPQIPTGQHVVAATDIRLGGGSIDVAATRSATRLETVVTRHLRVDLNVGAVVPSGKGVLRARLNGHPIRFSVVPTSRGREVQVSAGRASGTARLVVDLVG